MALALVAIVPAFVLAALIYTFSFNIPYLDQWEVYDLYSRYHHHSLTFADLFAQHSEHRMFFPRLFFIAAFYFEPYTDLVLLWMSWFLSCLSALCLWRLARFTGWSDSKGLLLLIGANALIFNILAFEDWLWGFQIGFLLPVFCVTAAVSFVATSKGVWSFFWAGFWSVINSFSVGAGLTTWLIIFPLLLFPEGKFRIRWTGLFLHLLAFGLCSFLYLHGYVKPTAYVGSSVTSDPAGAVVYFLIYVGGPFGIGSLRASLVAGSFLVVMYLCCALLLIRFINQAHIVARTLPWLTLAHYGLVCAAATTVGRMCFGPWQALSSRYVVFSSLIPIGLLFAGACLFPALVHRLKSPRLRQVLGIVIVAIPLICFARYVWVATAGISVWRHIYWSRSQSKAAVVFINLPYAAPVLNEVTYPHAEDLKVFLDIRNQLGPPLTVLPGPVLSSLEDSSSPNVSTGLVSAIVPVSDGHMISGWAYLPDSHRPTDLILVTLPDQQNQDAVVGMALPETPDPALAKSLHCHRSVPLKWTIFVRSGPNLNGLKAWSFDGQTYRAHQILLR